MEALTFLARFHASTRSRGGHGSQGDYRQTPLFPIILIFPWFASATQAAAAAGTTEPTHIATSGCSAGGNVALPYAGSARRGAGLWLGKECRRMRQMTCPNCLGRDPVL